MIMYYRLCCICCSCADMSQYQYVNVISTSIDNQSLILVRCPLYSFVPRDSYIIEKGNTTVGNQIVGFNLPFKSKARYAISHCKRKTKTHSSFNQTRVRFEVYFKKVNCFFYGKICKSLSIIAFTGYCICSMILIFILIKFSKITLGY